MDIAAGARVEVQAVGVGVPAGANVRLRIGGGQQQAGEPRHDGVKNTSRSGAGG